MAKKKPTNSSSKSIIPEKFQDYIYILVLAISVFAFLNKGFELGFHASDSMSYVSFKNLIAQSDESGEFIQWTPHVFGGMPNYSSLMFAAERTWDLGQQLFMFITRMFGSIFDSDLARVAMIYVIYAIGMYLLMRVKQKDRFVAFFTSFAATFSTQIILWIMIGHMTKPWALSMVPFVFLCLEQLNKKISLLYSALLVLFIHILFESSHIQMIYYFVLAFGVYFIIEIVKAVLSKTDLKKTLSTAGVLILAAGFGFLLSADKFLSILEYKDYSTRGKASIVSNADADPAGGNSYEYATQYSFSPEEMITFFVPNFYGFGHDSKLDFEDDALRGTRLGQMLKQYKVERLHTYWGQKEIQDAPPYLGILVIFLALIGIIYYKKNYFVIFLISISTLGLFLAFGKNASFLYDIFFNIMPGFNKFRAPSMSLVLLQLSVPILAGYGIMALIELKKQSKERLKKYLMGMYGFTGLVVLGLIMMSVMFESSYISGVENGLHPVMKQQLGPEYSLFAKYIYNQMISDWTIIALILVVGMALIYMYMNDKISKTIMYVGLGALLVFDFLRVDGRPIKYGNGKNIEKSFFVQDEVIRYLKADKEKFRVADNATGTQNRLAYFGLENVGGYHAAKLRIYQDVLDVANGGSTHNVNNPILWRLLNVKYIIDQQDFGVQPVATSSRTGEKLYRNNDYLPRVSFVNSVEVKSGIDILNSMQMKQNVMPFNPKEVAYVEEDLGFKIDTIGAGSNAKIVNYENEYIKVEAESAGNQLLLFSEIYYPPAWKAYVDGKEVNIIKTNYFMRSVVVPSGKHTIEMKYESGTFETGRTLSAVTNILLVLALLGGLYIENKDKFKKGTESAK